MRTRSMMLIAVIVGVAVFFAAGLYAGTAVKDEIIMKNAVYKEHTKGIATFSHKKHTEDYKAACGECHHDKDGKPLELKMGDDVQNCIECHKLTDPKPKGKKLKKKEKLAYHYEAIHYNCKDCHKKYNKEKGDKIAPVSCGKCHPKKQK